MEKSRMEILSGLQETLAELKVRIAEVENKLADLEQLVKEEQIEEAIPEEFVPANVEEDLPAAEEDMSPIDISIDIDGFETGPEASPLPDSIPDPEPKPEPRPEPEPEPKPEPSPAPGLLMDEEEPVTPKASINDRQERHVKKAVMDVMGQKLAWKTAIPGTPVKNVISAISLNDRVLFINTLFKEDPLAFQDTIAAFNAMSSFEEAEEYVRSNYPDWNLNSDLVFRLMMAVRRKLR